MKNRDSISRYWFTLVLALLIAVPAATGVEPHEAMAITPPENPTIAVQIGSSRTQVQVVFTPAIGIAKYTVRMYSSYDNYDTAKLTTSNYLSGQDLGQGNTPGYCNGDQVCIAIANKNGIKFTIQGYDSSDNPVTNESPKSLPHVPTQDLNPSASSPVDTNTSVIRIPFTPSTGQTTMSVRLYRSDDNYTQIFREVSGITAPGKDIEVPGGYTYRYSFRTIGSTLSTIAYLSSAWKTSPQNVLVSRHPNPPENVQLVGGNESFTANWTAPPTVVGADIIIYGVNFSSDKISWTYYQTTETSLTVSSLVNGQPYWVRVRSISSAGKIGEWVSSTSIIPSYIPSIPTLSVVGGDERIDAKWQAPHTDGGAPIVNYLIQYSSNGTTWSDITVDPAKRSHTITGLENGTQYTVRIYARNNTGLSFTNTSPITATPVGSPVPQTSAVTKIGTTRATVGMSVDTKGNTLTPYLEFGTPGGFDTTYLGDAVKGTNLQVTRDLTGLTPGYKYRIRSGVIVNDIPAYGTEFSFTTTPNAPADLAATMTGTTASVTWSAAATNDGNYMKYAVWAEQNGVESGNRCSVFTGGGVNCQITGLTPGKNYVIKATARATSATYGNGTSLPSSISVATLAPQVITFSFATLPRKGTQSLSTEFDLSSYGSSSAGLAVSYTTQTSAKCTIIGTTVKILQPGTCTIRASQTGNSKYIAATSVDASFVIAATQSISFSVTGIGTQTLGGSPLDLSTLATATSGLAVAFSSTTSSICTVSDTSVTYIGAGKCRIVASQIGDDNFDPAPNVPREITVNRGTQSTLTINSTTGTFGTEKVLTTTGGSGTGIVTFAIDSNSLLATATGCSITSDGLISMSAGKCAVIATKSDDIDYLSKNSASTLVTLQKASQTISFTPIAGSGSHLQGGSITVSVRSTSGLAVTISSDTETKCTVSGTQISLLADGMCTLRGAQAGDGNFNAATAVTTSFEISPKPIPETSPIEYTRLFAPNAYKVGDVVQLSVAPTTYQGSIIPGTYEFISTNPEGLSFSPTTVDSDGTTRTTASFTRSNQAFMLYAVFTPTDGVNFAQAQTYAAITVNAKPQTIVVSDDMDEFNRILPITFSGVESTGQVMIDLSPMTPQGNAANIQDQQAHCTISKQTVTRDNEGYCYIRVSAMGDGTFESSLGVGVFYFTKFSQSIVMLNTDQLNSLTAENISDVVDLSGITTASSSLTVSVSSPTTSVCTVTNLELTILNSGTCELKIEQSGDSTYQEATAYVYAFNVMRLEQDPLSLTSTSATFGTPLTLTASGGSGSGQFVFSVHDGLATGCAIQNAALVSTSSGSCLISVTREGDSSYLSKSTNPTLVEIARAAQTISFNLASLGTVHIGSMPLDVAGFLSTSSGSSASLRANDENICVVAGTTITILDLGTCSVTASQDGTDNHSPALDVVQTLTVTAVSTPTQVPSNSTQPNQNSSNNNGGNSDVTQTPSAGSPTAAKRQQAAPSLPASVKKLRVIKFTMKAPSGLPLSVTASGACRVTKIMKTVADRVKVGNKYVIKKWQIQTGWSLSFTKIGSCRTKFKNSGNDTFLALNHSRTVAVK